MRSKSEHRLQSQTIEYLSYKKFMVWRNNTGAIPQYYKGVKRLIRFGKVGSGDIFALKNGVFYSVEVKSPKGSPTLKQLEWIDEVNRNGGKAFIIKSLSDLVENLNE